MPTAALNGTELHWRDAGRGNRAVVLLHHGAEASALPMLGVPPTAIARALLFRVATTNAFVASGTVSVDLRGEARRYEQALMAIGI